MYSMISTKIDTLNYTQESNLTPDDLDHQPDAQALLINIKIASSVLATTKK